MAGRGICARPRPNNLVEKFFGNPSRAVFRDPSTIACATVVDHARLVGSIGRLIARERSPLQSFRRNRRRATANAADNWKSIPPQICHEQLRARFAGARPVR
jgi:hypothetical protein